MSAAKNPKKPAAVVEVAAVVRAIERRLRAAERGRLGFHATEFEHGLRAAVIIVHRLAARRSRK